MNPYNPNGFDDQKRFPPGRPQYNNPPQQYEIKNNQLVGEGPLQFTMPGANNYNEAPPTSNYSNLNYNQQSYGNPRPYAPPQNRFELESAPVPSLPISEPGFGFAFAGRPTVEALQGDELRPNTQSSAQFNPLNSYKNSPTIPQNNIGFSTSRPYRPQMDNYPSSFSGPGGFGPYENTQRPSNNYPGNGNGEYGNPQYRPETSYGAGYPEYSNNSRPIAMPNNPPSLPNYETNPQNQNGFARPGMPPQNNYSPRPGMPPQNNFSPRPGMPPQNNYTPRPGMPPQINGPSRIGGTTEPQRPPPASGMEWIQLKNNLIPSSAFVAGRNRNEPVYIIRSNYKNGIHVGTLSKGIGGAMISYSGKAIVPKEFSVLCAKEGNLKWVAAKGRANPSLVTHRLVLGGNDSSGSPFFIGKRNKNGRDYIGKVGPSINKGISYPYEGDEKKSSEYQMLAFA
ncbi:P30 adhesin [Smittium culicis]|uniref:p30 adhesin n=1 Tax=Smittium culicis TaxID=133412 RepID=A0A1R1XAY3_9FUNG|nr:P30 adhesin [Smittium culicis]